MAGRLCEIYEMRSDKNKKNRSIMVLSSPQCFCEWMQGLREGAEVYSASHKEMNKETFLPRILIKFYYLKTNLKMVVQRLLF